MKNKQGYIHNGKLSSITSFPIQAFLNTVISYLFENVDQVILF